MGNFSRNPGDRLLDARRNHYTAVRLQQGVPVLDADWNELGDLRRVEAEDIGRWYLGDGVPAGNDGFRILPLPGGGIGTIVLQSRAIGSASSLAVDVAASTAAAALGFGATNASAARRGSAPAQLTGRRSEPFSLAPGTTLVLQAEDHPQETVTFKASDFANPAASTADEVVKAINAALGFAVAVKGTGNDFVVQGGDGTVERAGRMLVAGCLALAEGDLVFSEQPLYENAALAVEWGVAKVDALQTSNDPQTVFLDVWEREVDSEEDPALVDTRIGIETAVRLRREWAVRVAPSATYAATIAARPPGHAYGRLAELRRPTGAIGEGAIVDQRDVDHAIRRTVAYRTLGGTVVVDADGYAAVLSSTRDAVRDLVAYLGTTFVQPTAPLAAGPVVGIAALGAVASVADQGLALLAARALDTRGAIDLAGQLLAAQQRLADVWTNAVVVAEPYRGAFKQMIDNVRGLLEGPATPGIVPLVQAVARRNLLEVTQVQARIVLELNTKAQRPTGALLLTYLGSLAATIVRNGSFDVRWKVSGSVTPADDLDVDVTMDSAWIRTLRRADGGVPLALKLGPGAGSAEFVISVQAPDVAAAATDMVVRVSARDNRSGLTYVALPKHLAIGSPPPPSEAAFAVGLLTANVSLAGDEFQVPKQFPSADFTLRVFNNTTSAASVNVSWQPTTSTEWGIYKGPFNPSGVALGAGATKDFDFQFVPPAVAGKALAFTFTVTNAGTGVKLAEVTLKMRTV